MSRIQLHLFPLPFPASTGVFVPVPVESRCLSSCSWSSSREASSRLGPKAKGRDTVLFGDRFSNDGIGREIPVDCNRTHRAAVESRLLPSHVDRIGRGILVDCNRRRRRWRRRLPPIPRWINQQENAFDCNRRGGGCRDSCRPTSIESAGESSSIAIVAGAAVESDSCRPTSIESAGESPSIAIVAGAAVESDSCRPTSIESARNPRRLPIVRARRW